MDVVLRSALRALHQGEPLAALQRTALRDDPQALVLRGIAFARLGDLERADALLQRAVPQLDAPRAFRACARAALAEVALARRDLRRAGSSLLAAERALAADATREDAAHVRLLRARHRLLLGDVGGAASMLATLVRLRPGLPTQALAAALAGEIALRRRQPHDARAAFAAARAVAQRSGLGALAAEIDTAVASLELPVARQLDAHGTRPLTLEQLDALPDDGALVLDGCRRIVRCGAHTVSLQRRPVLWTLLQELGTAVPRDVSRDTLVAIAFEARRVDASHRARLRVEIARLRVLLRPFAELRATAAGFVLRPHAAAVHVLVPPLDSKASVLLALLADGAVWSTRSLAEALGQSQRTVQRALAELLADRQVVPSGRGKLQRWRTAPLLGFAPCMLLPSTDDLR
jgi:tetratricopeptide (TPR) repeat protein